MANISEMLKGVVDVHIHGDPSVAKRRNTPEMMKEMSKY